jgi:hypothetical protein
MSNLADVTNQVQKYWAPVFSKELRAAHLLAALVNKDYEGQIKKGGDTVRVSQINAPTGQLLTVGTNADTFDSESISTSYVDIKADKRAVAAYEFEDLVSLQSQIDNTSAPCWDALKYAISNQINNYLYSLAVASTASPDHKLNSVSAMNAAQVAAIRLLAATAKWDESKGWYGLVDPSYMNDILGDSTLAHADYGAADAPTVSGKLGMKRYGFNIFEDNSRATDTSLWFQPDFMHLVQQTEVKVEISSLHAQKKFGVLMSVDLVFGAKLGIDGAKKCITAVAA